MKKIFAIACCASAMVSHASKPAVKIPIVIATISSLNAAIKETEASSPTSPIHSKDAKPTVQPKQSSNTCPYGTQPNIKALLDKQPFGYFD